MKIQSINVNLGRKVFHDQNEHSIEIGLQVELEPEEDSESVYYSLKNTLEGQLDTWEHEIRTIEKPILLPEMSVTATQASTPTPTLVTASEIKPKITKVKKEPVKKEDTQVKVQEQESVQENQGEYICPACGEKMLPKDGKDYFLCSKHWAYPDMIKKGIVKDRKF